MSNVKMTSCHETITM